MKMFSMSKRRSSFTLVEMLLVVMLVVLLSTAAGAYYLRTYERLKVARCARDLSLAIKYAKLVAAETQMNVYLVIDYGKSSFSLKRFVFDEEISEKREIVISNQYFRPVTLPSDIKFEGIWDSALMPTAVPVVDDERICTTTFYPDGTSDMLITQLGDGRTHYTVTLFSTGAGAEIKFGWAEDIKLPFVDLDAQNE